MSDFVETQMGKHRIAIRSLAKSHGATSGPVYVTGVLVGLNYALQQQAPATAVDTSELEALARELKALLDTTRPT